MAPPARPCARDRIDVRAGLLADLWIIEGGVMGSITVVRPKFSAWKPQVDAYRVDVLTWIDVDAERYAPIGSSGSSPKSAA